MPDGVINNRFDGDPSSILERSAGILGVELAQRIRAGRPETRALLISGYMDLRESLAETLPEGFRFVAKPFESRELIAKVREALDAPVGTGGEAES